MNSTAVGNHPRPGSSGPDSPRPALSGAAAVSARHSPELAELRAAHTRLAESLDELKRLSNARHTATTTMLQAVLDRLA
ncbi:hypothetical protein [Nocardia blacklockiae]|uniref:hypothetical protein n=1 Tax=Nocardia blacklockiae TaxID=480036 RepID=UPI001893E8EF|nr:hypothetical protein [Nocardia blacklockiae]MBF6170485.1 hypothetical protein [Nocardia blacklockiae]